jgi:hypothetical protein
MQKANLSLRGLEIFQLVAKAQLAHSAKSRQSARSRLGDHAPCRHLRPGRKAAGRVRAMGSARMIHKAPTREAFRATVRRWCDRSDRKGARLGPQLC